MKVKISYTMSYEREVEMTPEKYCELRANSYKDTNLFPKGCSFPHLESYNEMDVESQNELDEYWDKREKGKRKNRG